MCQYGPTGGACFTLCIATVAYFIAYATPGWWVTEDDYDVGFWYSCLNITRCSDTSSLSFSSQDWFQQTRIIATIALGTLVLSLVFVVASIKRSPPVPLSLEIMTCLFSLATAVMILIVMIFIGMEVPANTLNFSFATCLIPVACCFLVLPMTVCGHRWGLRQDAFHHRRFTDDHAFANSYQGI